MKIKLIYPEWGHFPLVYRRYIPTMAPAILAALTPNDIEISFTDERIEKFDVEKDCDFDLVAISMMTSQANRAYELSRIFREKGIPVVLGGIHASMMFEEAAKNADAVAVGEAEDTWPLILEDFRKGKLQKVYTCSKPPATIPFPDWSIYDKNIYLPMNSLEVSRGCPVNCEMCSVSQTFGASFRMHDSQRLLENVHTLEKNIFIINDNLHLAKRKVNGFLKSMADSGKQWVGLGSPSIAEDLEYIKLLKQSNCWAMYIDLSPWISAGLNGLVDDLQLKKAEEYINIIRDNNIKVIASFVFGFDHDKKDVFERTVEFAKSNNLEEAEFHILTPYPRTRLYERLLQENRLLTTDFSKYSTSSVVFKPKNMSPEELYEGYIKAWKSFYPFEQCEETDAGPIIRTFSCFPFNNKDLLKYQTGKWVESVVRSH